MSTPPCEQVRYVAMVSTPGCLPDSEPISFDTIEAAWDYLAQERWISLLGAEVDPSTDRTMVALAEQRDTVQELGSINGPTPGRDESDWGDLGLVYEVVIGDE